MNNNKFAKIENNKCALAQKDNLNIRNNLIVGNLPTTIGGNMSETVVHMRDKIKEAI